MFSTSVESEKQKLKSYQLKFYKLTKMKRIVFITGLLLFCLMGCSQNKSNSNGDCEDFKTFIDSYNNDFEFQKSRTVFPFINESVEYDEVMNEEGESEFKKLINTTETLRNEWKKIDFTWDSSYAERETDAYTQEIETRGDTTFIYYKGVQNGISIQAIFLCKDKQWYLQKIIDSSM